MTCKSCGWNTTHTTWFYASYVKDSASFSLTATSVFWLSLLFLLVICVWARARAHTPNVSWMRLLQDHEGAVTRDHFDVGDFVSTDQFICKTPRRVPTRYGHNHKIAIFRAVPSLMMCISLFQVKNQVSLDANESVLCKACFNHWLYDLCVCEVKQYHGDNVIFSAEEFWHDCEEKWQSQSFSGVVVQHQNARAEQAIQAIMYMAQNIMVHAFLHWKEWVWLIYLSGPLLWNIWFGFITMSWMLGRALLHWNWLPGSALTIRTSSAANRVDVRCLYLKLNYWMTKTFHMELTSSNGSIFWIFRHTLFCGGQYTSFAYQLHLTPIPCYFWWFIWNSELKWC